MNIVLGSLTDILMHDTLIFIYKTLYMYIYIIYIYICIYIYIYIFNIYNSLYNSLFYCYYYYLYNIITNCLGEDAKDFSQKTAFVKTSASYLSLDIHFNSLISPFCIISCRIAISTLNLLLRR